MEVYRAILCIFWMHYHVILHDCVSLTIKFSLTMATFDAHIYREVVDIYILARYFARESIDSEDCVLYSELA